MTVSVARDNAPRPAARADSGRDWRHWLAEEMSRAADGRDYRAFRFPCRIASFAKLLDLLPDEPGFLWDPPVGGVSAGVGGCALIEVEGPRRFGDLRRQGQELLDSVSLVAAPGCAQRSLRLYGGLAFTEGRDQGPLWRGFGDGWFLLPRWVLFAAPSGAIDLTLTVRAAEIARSTDIDALLEQCGTLLEELATPLDAEPLPAARWDHRWHDREGFIAEVEAIRSAIGEGRFSKIVAARSSTLEFEEAVDLGAVLRRLRAGLRSSNRFAFRRADGDADHAAFLGATPEKLVSLEGLDLRSEAVAGSRANHNGIDAGRLLASAKDGFEHRLVVEEIVRRLEPLCRRLSVSPSPHIRELRDILHLQTDLAGVLARPIHVLDVVRRLHPTPAVCGLPTADARHWLAENESLRRGWYAGPVGWFDGRGDGEFWVALRSCLLRSRQVTLFAGAGIVADSEPQLEFEETELKQATLLPALGVGEAEARDGAKAGERAVR